MDDNLFYTLLGAGVGAAVVGTVWYFSSNGKSNDNEISSILDGFEISSIELTKKEKLDELRRKMDSIDKPTAEVAS